MPPPDISCQVINGQTGYARQNQSFILGRIMRDFEIWMDDRVRRHLKHLLQPQSLDTIGSRSHRIGLCVSIYRADEAKPGSPGYDWLYFMGFGTALLQLAIAAIPFGRNDSWDVLLVTAAGIVLSFSTGSLRQWSTEKWACRRSCKKTVILTKGNGSQHAIVIIGDGKGLDIEDPASGPNTNVSSFFRPTPVALLALCFLWVLLLIIAAGVEENSWYLFAVGGIGMLENIFVAASPRSPAAFGMPLMFEDVIGEPKAMDTLFALEEAYPRVGRSLLVTFFPGKLRLKEQERWDELECLADALDESRRN